MAKSLIRLKPVIVFHYSTLRDPRSLPRLRDFAGFLFTPAALGVLAAILRIKISSTTAAALVTVTGILAAFFFQLSVQLLNRAADLALSNPTPSRETTDYASLLKLLSANAVYSALMAVAASTFALLAGISSCGWTETLFVSLTVFLCAHLAWTLMLIASRVFLLTQARLIFARTRPDL